MHTACAQLAGMLQQQHVPCHPAAGGATFFSRVPASRPRGAWLCACNGAMGAAGGRGGAGGRWGCHACGGEGGQLGNAGVYGVGKGGKGAALLPGWQPAPPSSPPPSPTPPTHTQSHPPLPYPPRPASTPTPKHNQCSPSPVGRGGAGGQLAHTHTHLLSDKVPPWTTAQHVVGMLGDGASMCTPLCCARRQTHFLARARRDCHNHQPSPSLVPLRRLALHAGRHGPLGSAAAAAIGSARQAGWLKALGHRPCHSRRALHCGTSDPGSGRIRPAARASGAGW